jgi:hypothetical protein
MQLISEANVQLNPNPQTPIVSAGQFRPRAKRLIVLVAQDKVDEALLARRIWELTAPTHTDVLYVALVRDADDESRARRCLALLASLTRDDRIHVATQVFTHTRWPAALRPICSAGDRLICTPDQTLKRLGRPTQLLSDQLMGAFSVPVLVLEGVGVKPTQSRRRTWRILREAVPLAIVAGFLEFQMWITTQVLSRAAGSAVLGLSVLAEFGLIWLWVSNVS